MSCGGRRGKRLAQARSPNQNRSQLGSQTRPTRRADAASARLTRRGGADHQLFNAPSAADHAVRDHRVPVIEVADAEDLLLQTPARSCEPFRCELQANYGQLRGDSRSCERLGEKRTTGLEPATFGLGISRLQGLLALPRGIGSAPLPSAGVRSAQFGTWFGTRLPSQPVSVRARRLTELDQLHEHALVPPGHRRVAVVAPHDARAPETDALLPAKWPPLRPEPLSAA
jgi:hypothetical protein